MYIIDFFASTAPLLGGTETSVYGAQDGTPSGRQRAGCVFSTSLTGSRNRQALVGPAQVNSNGVNSNVLTPTLEDRHLAEGNHARTGDKSDSKYSGQAADWPDQKYKVDQEQGNPGKGLRVENAARSVQPICIRAKHVPSILRRHKPQKFHHYKQQQQQQHPRQQQEEHPVGISEHTPTDRKLSRKNRHEMKEDSESDSSANMASSTPRPLAHSSTDGNASDNESSRMPGPVHLTVSERQVRVGSNDSDENSGSINVDNLVSVKICSAVSADKTTEKNCITTKDAQIVAAKSQPQPATELSDLSRSVSDNTSTGKTATSGTSNISRPPLTSDATAVTIATTTITTSAFTVSESKLNTLGTSSPDYRGVFSCQSAAPGGVAVTSPCHVGENYAQKSARGGCEVMKSTANQRSSGGKTSRNGLGEQRVLATDRYALDDANYNIIAEKYRLFYRFVR